MCVATSFYQRPASHVYFIPFSFCETYCTLSEHFLKSGKAAEQGYKACAGLSKLEQRYGKQRLEAACGKALAYSTAPSLRTIASILKNGLDKPDKAESQTAQSKANSYGITRGAAYFRKGGDHEC